MRRAGRSDVESLLQEARGIELLASEVEVPTERVQEYWIASADLITLVGDIERYGQEQPDAAATDPAMIELRRRLRDVAARLSELSLE